MQKMCDIWQGNASERNFLRATLPRSKWMKLDEIAKFCENFQPNAKNPLGRFYRELIIVQTFVAQCLLCYIAALNCAFRQIMP